MILLFAEAWLCLSSPPRLLRPLQSPDYWPSGAFVRDVDGDTPPKHPILYQQILVPMFCDWPNEDSDDYNPSSARERYVAEILATGTRNFCLSVFFPDRMRLQLYYDEAGPQGRSLKSHMLDPRTVEGIADVYSFFWRIALFRDVDLGLDVCSS